MNAEQQWKFALECRGCGIAFNSTERCPLLLLCGHTFCRNCCSFLVRTVRKVICPIDQKSDVRALSDISVSEHYLRSLLRTEVGCYWHFQQPGQFYCPENLVSACEECTQGMRSWEWKSLEDVDLPALLTSRIESMLSDRELKQKIYIHNPELSGRYRDLPQASARERQMLYFYFLSYKEEIDYIVPRPVTEPAFNYYRDCGSGTVEISRFRRVLPSKYTRDFEKAHTWQVDSSPKQVEAVSFVVSQAVKLSAVTVGKECIKPLQCGNVSLVLLQGRRTDSPPIKEIARSKRYIALDPCIEILEVLPPVPLLANTVYTLKAKYEGKGVYYGDPRDRADLVRGAHALEVRFLASEFAKSDFKNGDGSRTGPILKLYFKTDIHNGRPRELDRLGSD